MLSKESRRKSERKYIDIHIKRQGTQLELKKRVDERLNLTPKKEAEKLAANVALNDINVDKLLEFNEFDAEHLL